MLYSLIQLSFNRFESKYSMKVLPIEHEREQTDPHIVKAFNEVWVYCARDEVEIWKPRIIEAYKSELIAQRNAVDDLLQKLDEFERAI